MEKVSGYKIIKWRVANGNVPFEEKEEIVKKYGEELPHNFIKEFIHIL